MDTDTLLNKLEIHFSKKKNGGGEVDECEMLPDSGTVVLTFVDNNSEPIIIVQCYLTDCGGFRNCSWEGTKTIEN